MFREGCAAAGLIPVLMATVKAQLADPKIVERGLQALRNLSYAPAHQARLSVMVSHIYLFVYFYVP